MALSTAGSAALPGDVEDRAARPAPLYQAITAVIVFGPLVAMGVAGWRLWGHGISGLDVALSVVFFYLSGHGATVGFHRLLTHRSFVASRGLKIALALAGSLAVEGTPISWVANHRRHHAYTDAPGDPHSPYVDGEVGLRGFWHAHCGWLFRAQPTEEARWAKDLVGDADLVVIGRLFPALAVASFVLPGVAGGVAGALLGADGLWSWSAAASAALWAGAVRICVLHHVTWSVNSVCHLFGSRPFVTRAADRSGNVAVLAPLGMGENFHNLHHSCPALARHGVGRFELDSSARLIRWFELAGWATEVRWPTPERLAERRR